MANEIIIPSNPNDLKQIKSAVQDIVDCMTRIAGERDAMKDIINDLAEKYTMPKKFVNRMAKTHYKRSFDQDAAESDDFAELYVAVTESK